MESSYLRHLTERIALFNDEDAFKKLFHHFYKPLCNFAASLIQQEDAAQDLIAELFISIWNTKSNLLAVKNIKTYLYTAAKNQSIRYLSRQHEEFNIDNIPFNAIPLDYDCPESLIISQETISIIEMAIEELPIRCKLVFRLIKFDRLTYQETADILDISIKTVDAQLVKAIKRLHERLKKVSKTSLN